MRRFVVTAAIAVVLACCAGDTPPPTLPAEASSLGGYAEIDEDWLSIPTRFELASGLSTNVDHAPAYTLTGDITTAEVERLARAVGLRGRVTKEDYGWRAGVFDGSGPGFSVGDDLLFSVSSKYFPPTPCNDTQDIDASAICAAPTTTTLVPPKPLPSVRTAERLARRSAAKWGIDVAQVATVTTVEDASVRVRFIRTVEGLRAKGFEFVIEVDGDGVAGAYGFLATPQRVGEVQLTSLEHAVQRMNQSGSAYSELFTVKLRAVEVGLMIAYTGEHDVWLAPAYVFTTDDGRTVAAPAAQDKYFGEPGN